jgi:hypothetical protein
MDSVGTLNLVEQSVHANMQSYRAIVCEKTENYNQGTTDGKRFVSADPLPTKMRKILSVNVSLRLLTCMTGL